jgi:hypothetical protein
MLGPNRVLDGLDLTLNFHRTTNRAAAAALPTALLEALLEQIILMYWPICFFWLACNHNIAKTR